MNACLTRCHSEREGKKSNTNTCKGNRKKETRDTEIEMERMCEGAVDMSE